MLFPYLPFEPPNGSPQHDAQSEYCRYYEIAGITIRVESDLPLINKTFLPKFKHFEVSSPGTDLISIHHHFELPDLSSHYLGKEIYRKLPWAIHRMDNSWIYECIAANGGGNPFQISVFSTDHTIGRIYNGGQDGKHFREGGFHSLTLFPTDQVLLARIVADRNACYMHSVGVVLNGKGFLFVGHSGAGKSTISKLLQDRVRLLCDDRNIVRRWIDGFKVHGTWSHGEVPVVSSESAPLAAIIFLTKSQENTISPVQDRKIITQRLLTYLIKPLVTADWWEKEFDLIEQMAREVRCYDVEFDKSGKIVDSILSLADK